MGQANPGELSQSFTLTEGGPGAAIMKRLHLVRQERGAKPGRTALIVMAVFLGAAAGALRL